MRLPCRSKGSDARPAGSTCNDRLHIDRVALLFLSIGALAQDAAWAAWIAGAEGLLPVQSVQVRIYTLYSDF